jgi:hypothetical protein
MEAILDHILQRLKYNYSKYFPILDALLAKPTPVDADINSLRNHVPQNVVALGYFFDRLSSPSWLVPLHDAGYFKQAIEPIYDTTQSTVSFPLWSESRYLVRMAPLAPKEVLVVRLVSFLT